MCVNVKLEVGSKATKHTSHTRPGQAVSSLLESPKNEGCNTRGFILSCWVLGSVNVLGLQIRALYNQDTERRGGRSEADLQRERRGLASSCSEPGHWAGAERLSISHMARALPQYHTQVLTDSWWAWGRNVSILQLHQVKWSDLPEQRNENKILINCISLVLSAPAPALATTTALQVAAPLTPPPSPIRHTNQNMKLCFQETQTVWGNPEQVRALYLKPNTDSCLPQALLPSMTICRAMPAAPAMRSQRPTTRQPPTPVSLILMNWLKTILRNTTTNPPALATVSWRGRSARGGSQVSTTVAHVKYSSSTNPRSSRAFSVYLDEDRSGSSRASALPETRAARSVARNI